MKRSLLLSVFLCLLATTVYAGGTVKIGLMCPLTGSWASEGQDMKDIVTLMAEDLNKNGGLIGKTIEIVVEDDAGDPRSAALAAQKLSTRGITAVIGTYGSSITEASQSIYDESEIIQIANGATSNRLSEKGLKYFFRTCPRNDEQAMVAAKAVKKMGFKSVAVLHDNTSYAKGLADEAKSFMKDIGVNVVFFDALTPGERDFTAILTKMKAAKPEAVLFTGYYPEAGLLLKQKKEMNWNVPFIGGDATNNPDLVEIAGKDAAAGFFFLSPPVPQDLPTQDAKDFLAAFKAKYNKLPGSIWAVLAGDGFRTITAAIKATKSTDTNKLADYLHKDLKDLEGLTGKISFNDAGDRVGDVYRLYEVDAEGKFNLNP